MYLGINTHNHDASVCLVDHDEVVFAAHAERYSRRKNDNQINADLMQDMLAYGTPSAVYWYEQPWKRSIRQWIYGQKANWYNIRKTLAEFNLGHLPIQCVPHHQAHAAHGYQSSQYNEAMVLVIDAIGEWMTTSIWYAGYGKLECKWKQNYPHSMGLFYSAITQDLGYKPNEEEFIVMGMAAYGYPQHVEHMRELLFEHFDPPNYKTIFMHRGIKGLLPSWWKAEDIAASAQFIWEDYLVRTVRWISKTYGDLPIVITGGGALNCVANNRVRHMVPDIHVPANPGDAGLALGAVAAHHMVKPTHAYLGHDIKQAVDVTRVVQSLLAGNMVGIANGRAEWGPRALGNRSVLADPRNANMRDKVNEIKNREKFRPFAPVVLKEHVRKLFDADHNDITAMQYAMKCLVPTALPAVCHVDGTARVQSVASDSSTVVRQILEAWYQHTGCAVLLNTSMNVRGEPLVNTWADAQVFSATTGVEVF